MGTHPEKNVFLWAMPSRVGALQGVGAGRPLPEFKTTPCSIKTKDMKTDVFFVNV